MNSEIALEKNDDSQPVSRRQFLIKGTTGTLGVLALAASSSRIAEASLASFAMQESYFIRLTQQFASNVGFSLNSQAAVSYIERVYGVRSDPWRQYQRPLAWNYSYQSAWGYYWSTRYSHTHPSYILYPWMRGNENGLVTFQSLATTNYFANYLAAPTIWALNRASLYIAKRSLMDSRYQISQALLPNCECQSSSSQGRFQESYPNPDSYTSFDGSRVTVDYQRVARNWGEVKVEYRNPLNGDRDFDYVEPVPLS